MAGARPRVARLAALATLFSALPSTVGLEDVALAFGATLSNAASYTQLYAATLAVQDINEDSTLLPGYNMQLIAQRTFCSSRNRALLDWVTSRF